MIHYWQSRQSKNFLYACHSLDAVLGLVGGLAAIILSLLKWSLSSFENFRLQNTMIRYFYQTQPLSEDLYEEPATEHDAQQALVRVVAKRGRYWYNYHEFQLARFIRQFCCCLKKFDCYQRRQDRLQRHIDATNQLQQELDVINIIKTNRISNFLAKMQLHKQQRNLVNSFRAHQVDDLKLDEEENHPKAVDDEAQMLITGIQADHEEGNLLEGIELKDLEEDHRHELESLVDYMKKKCADSTDAMILYEITGYQGTAIPNWSEYEDVCETSMAAQTLSDIVQAAAAADQDPPSPGSDISSSGRSDSD